MELQLKYNQEFLPYQIQLSHRRIELVRKFEGLRGDERKIINQIEEEENRIDHEFESDREELQGRLGEEEARLLSELEAKESEGTGGLAQEYRKFHSFVKSLKEYKSSLELIERVERTFKKSS